MTSHRERAEKLIRRHARAVGIASVETIAILSLDLAFAFCQVEAEAYERAAKITEQRCGTSTIAVKEIRALICEKG